MPEMENTVPRPQRKRTIYQLPVCRTFEAENAEGEVTLTLDELEALRLADLENLSQAECAERFHVSRTTAQNIILSARRKTADALTNGKTIRIGGGDVEFSDDAEFGCCRWTMESVHRTGGIQDCREVRNMKIAVTYDNTTGEIFQHFGRTEFFKLYDVNDGRVARTEVVSTNGQGHGALAGVLYQLQADVLICGGIGGGAQMALQEAGIRFYGGCAGSADQAVKDFLAGKLDYQEDVRCEHHEGHEGGCAHEGGCCHS